MVYLLYTLVILGARSLVGGIVGEQVFCMATASLNNDLVKAVQAGVLALMLVLILIYTLRQDAMPTFHLKGPVAIACVGLDLKQATAYSLATIFFSQLSKLGLNAASSTLWSVEMSFLPAVVLPAVVGGMLGTRINRMSSDSTVRRTYLAIMVALLLLSCYNFTRGLG